MPQQHFRKSGGVLYLKLCFIAAFVHHLAAANLHVLWSGYALFSVLSHPRLVCHREEQLDCLPHFNISHSVNPSNFWILPLLKRAK
jgi:hypothetical protein